MDVPVPVLPSPVRWLAVLCVMGFIFYVSIITVPPEIVVDGDGNGVSVSPESGSGGADEGTDVFELLEGGFDDIVNFTQAQWRHVVAYGVLAYALAYATVDWPWNRWQRAVFVVGSVAVYGLGIEIAQQFTAARQFEVGDVVANTLGACLVLPWYVVRPSVRVVDVRELL